MAHKTNALPIIYDSLTIDTVEPSQFEAVADIERSLQPDAWDKQTLLAMYEQRQKTGFGVLGAYQSLPHSKNADKRWVGYLVYHQLDVSELLRLGVDKAYQGRGIAWRLMMAWLDGIQTDTALLEVRADNKSALHLYDKAGFHAIHRRRGYYQTSDEAIDAVVMERRVD